MLVLKIIFGSIAILIFVRLLVYFASRAWHAGYFDELKNINKDDDKEL